MATSADIVKNRDVREMLVCAEYRPESERPIGMDGGHGTLTRTPWLFTTALLLEVLKVRALHDACRVLVEMPRGRMSFVTLDMIGCV